jgi:hypothetical protein
MLSFDVHDSAIESQVVHYALSYTKCAYDDSWNLGFTDCSP